MDAHAKALNQLLVDGIGYIAKQRTAKWDFTPAMQGARFLM